MDRLSRIARRLPALSIQTRQMAAMVGGIVLGVLLVATAWAPAQLLGAVCIGGGLLLARGVSFAVAWVRDPAGQSGAFWRRTRQAAPAWAWQGLVGVLLVVALALMTRELLTTGEIDAGTAGNFGKGAIALAMMASLLFWNGGVATWRPGRRAKLTDRRKR